MPEDVPADSRKANYFSGRLQDLSLNDACVVAAARNVRWEDKPTRTVPLIVAEQIRPLIVPESRKLLKMISR
jgi:hypothetical protein